jgi:hypothetical protein
VVEGDSSPLRDDCSCEVAYCFPVVVELLLLHDQGLSLTLRFRSKVVDPAENDSGRKCPYCGLSHC